jgi:hypothetical protein
VATTCVFFFQQSQDIDRLHSAHSLECQGQLSSANSLQLVVVEVPSAACGAWQVPECVFPVPSYTASLLLSIWPASQGKEWNLPCLLIGRLACFRFGLAVA